MSIKPAHKGCFKVGTNTVAQITKWGYGGIANNLVASPYFLEEFKKYQYTMADGGKIDFEGWWDASDTNGQLAIITAAINKTVLSVANTNDPRLYYDATGYFELSSGAEALVENAGKIDADAESGLVQISFTLQLSGGYMKIHT